MRKSLVKLSLSALSILVSTSMVHAESHKKDEKHDLKAHLNKDVIIGNWKQLKGKIQQKWANITDDDILKMKGSAIELEGKLQERHGYSKEQAQKEVKEFLEQNPEMPRKDVIIGNWKQFKGKVQQKWAKLTDDEVLKMKGSAIELEGKLQEKYGYSKEQAQQEVHDFLEAHKSELGADSK